MEPRSPALQADFLPSEPQGSPSVDHKPLQRLVSTPSLLAEAMGALGFTLHSQTLLGGIPAQVLQKGKPRLRAPEKPVGPDSLWEGVWGLRALTAQGGLRGASAAATPVGEGAGSLPDSVCFEYSGQGHGCATGQVRGLAGSQQTAVSCSTPQLLVVRRGPLGSLGKVGPAGCRLRPARKDWCWGHPRPVHVTLPARPLTSWAALPARHGARTGHMVLECLPKATTGVQFPGGAQPRSTRNKVSEESAPQVWRLTAQAQRGSAGLCPCPRPLHPV